VKAAGYVLVVVGSAFLVIAVAAHASFMPSGVAAIVLNGGACLVAGIGCVAVAWRRGRRDAEISRVTTTGLAGTGTITSSVAIGTNQASGTPSRRIGLSVALADRLVFQATVTKVIAQCDLPRYQPGCVFPVRVDSDDFSVVVIVDSASVTWAASSATLVAGVPGTALVTGLFDPAATGAEAPLWGLVLRVQAADGRPSYDVRLSTVGPDGLSRPHRGERFPVRIDSDDPRRIAVDWASPVSQQRSIGRGGRAIRR
jgi:hypothetical protein